MRFLLVFCLLGALCVWSCGGIGKRFHVISLHSSEYPTLPVKLLTSITVKENRLFDSSMGFGLDHRRFFDENLAVAYSSIFSNTCEFESLWHEKTKSLPISLYVSRMEPFAVIPFKNWLCPFRFLMFSWPLKMKTSLSRKESEGTQSGSLKVPLEHENHFKGRINRYKWIV